MGAKFYAGVEIESMRAMQQHLTEAKPNQWWLSTSGMVGSLLNATFDGPFTPGSTSSRSSSTASANTRIYSIYRIFYRCAVVRFHSPQRRHQENSCFIEAMLGQANDIDYTAVTPGSF